MPLLEDLQGIEPASARRQKPQYPAGWEPGIAWDGRQGTITSRPTADPTPDWTALIIAWGFDPERVEIVEPVQVRTWDAAIGNGEVRTMRYHRAKLRSKSATAVPLDDLLALVKRRKAATATETGDSAFVTAFNDWQLGKKGTPAAVDRIVDGIDRSVLRLKELRRLGRRIGTVILPGVGDLGEDCDGHYDMQTFEIELNRREQNRLGRRLVYYGVESFAPLVERVLCPAVPGNHGENRKNGKAFTSFGDNADLEIYEGVAEACATNPSAFGHVSFVIPKDELTLTIQPTEHVILGLAHGHSARGSGSAEMKVADWWKRQAFGRRQVGDADILLSAHNHHLSVIEYGARVHIQAPTEDSGSQWFEETAGLPSRSGMLTFLVTPHWYQDIQVV
jgi:hypothetical protein